MSTATMALLAVVVLWVPGLAVGYAGGLRGVTAWGTAPLLSLAVVGATSVVTGFGPSWSWATLAAGTAVVTVAAAVAWFAAARWRSPAVHSVVRVRRQVLLTVGGTLLIAAAFQARRLMVAIGGPERVAQTYDTPYHLNSVRKLLETGDASPLHMTIADPSATSGFYPASWHAVTALVAQSGDVAAAANWVSVVVTALVWPASMLVLGRMLFGPRPVFLGLTIVLSLSMTQFPVKLTAFGVLYPNLLSYAVLPALLALVLLTLWRARGRRRLAPLFLTGAGTFAVLLAQPNGLFTLGYVVVPVLIHYVAHVTARLRRAGRNPAVTVLPAVVLVVGCLAAYWLAGRSELVRAFRTSVSWPERLSGRQAFEDAFSLAAMHPTQTPNVLVAGLVVIGLVASFFVARWRWLPFAYGVLVALFVVSASAPEYWRALLTGYWYGDVQRLAAQLPLLAVPLAVIGAWVVVRGVSELAALHGPDRQWWRRGTSVPALAAVLALVVVVVLPRTMAFREAYEYVTYQYRVDSERLSEGLVEEYEYAMMDEVARIVPEGVVVAGNPWNGSTMTWALADREPLFPHTKTVADPDRVLIATRLGDAGEDPAVCEALDRQDVGFVLTSPSMLWGRHPAGFEGLEPGQVARVGEVVARVGSVRLWEITACD